LAEKEEFENQPKASAGAVTAALSTIKANQTVPAVVIPVA